MNIPLSQGITGDNEPAKQTTMAAGGQWQVPPQDRPANWRTLPKLMDPWEDEAPTDQPAGAAAADPPEKPFDTWIKGVPSGFTLLKEELESLEIGQRRNIVVPAKMGLSAFSVNLLSFLRGPYGLADRHFEISAGPVSRNPSVVQLTRRPNRPAKTEVVRRSAAAVPHPDPEDKQQESVQPTVAIAPSPNLIAQLEEVIQKLESDRAKIDETIMAVRRTSELLKDRS